MNLKAPLSILAAQTVQVDNGGMVLIDGKGVIYAADGQRLYNQAGYGNISSTKINGLSEKPINTFVKK